MLLVMITMPRVNRSVYAATKACAMDLARAYQEAGQLEVSFVRAFNVYGPGQAHGGDHPQKILPTFATRGWRGDRRGGRTQAAASLAPAPMPRQTPSPAA